MIYILVILNSITKKHFMMFFYVLMELKEKIQQSNIPIIVDLFDWERLPDSFHKNIEKHHEMFFSNRIQNN